MATEPLIVELDARTAKLDAKLAKTDERMDKLDDSVKKTDGSLKKFGGVAKGVGAVILKTGAAAIALGTAVSAMVLSAASGRKELEQMARMANTTEQESKSLSFATSQFGINAEQIADITKDISDRLGEFATAGTGTFQDYADVMGMTKEEARAVAMEFQNLSGDEVIGNMVKNMESVNATGAQMTFVLESMGNDLSKLKPLFADNSAQLTLLRERFVKVNESMSITQHQADGLKEVSTTFDLMTSSFGNATTAISATLAPVMDDFFNDVINVVPTATQAIVDFVNSFLEAENIQSVSAATKRVEDSINDLAQAETELESLIAKRKRTAARFDPDRVAQRAKQNEIDAERTLLAELQARLVVLKDIEKLEDAKVLEGDQIGGATGGELDPLVLADEEKKKLEALKQFTMTRAELLDAELVADIERLELAAETFKLKDEELSERRLEIIRDFAQKKEALESDSIDQFKDGTKEEVEADKIAAQEKLGQQQTAIRAGMALNTLLFEDNKAIAAGLIVANAATAIMRSLAINPYDYANVALIAATGAIQLANALSSSKGGGSTSSPSGGAPPPQSNFEPETADFELNSATTGGSVSTTINFGVDSGDELIDAIATALNKAQREGRA